MKPKLYTSRSWLMVRFIIEAKTIAEMAEEAKVSQMTIRRELEREGLIRK